MQKRHIALFALTALLGAALGRAAPVNPYGLNSSGKLVPADNVNTSLLSGPITCTTAQGTGAGPTGPWSVELSDGTSYYVGPQRGQLPSSLVSGRLDVNIGASSATVPVSGTFWQTTQPVSAAALPLPSGAATEAKQPAIGLAGAPSVDVISIQGVAGGTAVPISGTVTSTPSGTQTVTGTVNLGTTAGGAGQLCLDATLTDGTQQSRITDGSNVATVKAASTAAGASDKALVVAVSPNNSVAVTGTFWQATQPVSAASLPLPSGAAADSSVNGILLTQNSTTSGQTGPLVQGAVTSAAPTYTTARTSPLSLTTAGALRVDGSASTQPVSGPLTDVQLRATPVPVSGTTTTLATAGTTPTLSVVAMTTTGAQVWAAASTAKVRKIYNYVANDTLYCVYYDGTNNVTSEATSHFSVLPGQTWEMPNFPGIVEYTGAVRCALKSSTGNINATQVL